MNHPVTLWTEQFYVFLRPAFLLWPTMVLGQLPPLEWPVAERTGDGEGIHIAKKLRQTLPLGCDVRLHFYNGVRPAHSDQDYPAKEPFMYTLLALLAIAADPAEDWQKQEA